MSNDAKPYTHGDVPDGMSCTDCGEPDCCLMGEQSRIIATVEALERAEADLVTCRGMLNRLVGGEEARDLMEASEMIERHAVRRAKQAAAERDALYAALSEAGISHGGTVDGLRQGLEVVSRLRAERDDAQKWVAAQQSVVADVLRERDEALRLLKQARVGERIDQLAADNARLREALENVERNADRPGDMFSIASAALAGTSDEVKP